jgi:small-conductance mechanosensitive channel
MTWYTSLRDLLTDDRLMANVIAGHALVTITFLLAVLTRRGLREAGEGLKIPFATAWIHSLGDQAVKSARDMVFWATIALHTLIATAVIGYHFVGRDIRHDVRHWCMEISSDSLWDIGFRLGLALGSLVVAWFATRIVRQLGPRLETWAASGIWWQDSDGTLAAWRRVAQSYVVLLLRLAALWCVGNSLGAAKWTDRGVEFLFRVLSIIMVSRLAALTARLGAEATRTWGDQQILRPSVRLYWERLARLLPFGERCLEAAIYVLAAAHVFDAFYFIESVAAFGPHVVKCIGIFFATRVLIEFVHVLLAEAFGIHRQDRPIDQKAQTLAPLLGSLAQYVLYIGSGVMILDALGIPITPILAGVSVVGLAVGLGAQNMITDIVSGFFILFENQYLVGDSVEIGHAAGTVEQVAIRVTHIRDNEGKLHIIPNGQIKTVVSYSKGYVNAVVDLEVSTSADLETMFHAMTEAGMRLRRSCTEVLEPTIIHGLVALDAKAMTIRAVTRVEPGSHDRMQNEYRRLLKQVLDEDQNATAGPRAA